VKRFRSLDKADRSRFLAIGRVGKSSICPACGG